MLIENAKQRSRLMEQLTWLGSTIIVTILVAIRLIATIVRSIGRVIDDHRVVSMSLDMLLEILRPLEGLAAKFTSVWLQGDVNSDM